MKKILRLPWKLLIFIKDILFIIIAVQIMCICRYFELFGKWLWKCINKLFNKIRSKLNSYRFKLFIDLLIILLIFALSLFVMLLPRWIQI